MEKNRNSKKKLSEMSLEELWQLFPIFGGTQKGMERVVRVRRKMYPGLHFRRGDKRIFTSAVRLFQTCVPRILLIF